MSESPVEKLRRSYKPNQVQVLFVGESPPAGGDFFYAGNSRLSRYTQEAFTEAFGVTFKSVGSFLDYFRRAGCYLDDLCLTPVNHLSRSERRGERRRGIVHLAERIADMSPRAVVVVMRGIAPHVEQAVDAGAHFIVSPHCEEELTRAMIATELVTMIGAFTPSEIMKARRLGSDVVKLYPGSLGTPRYLRSLRGPFPNIPIMPTGGVNIENIKEWFDAGAFAVGAGSALCPSAWALEGRFTEMTERAQAFVKEVERAR